MLTTEPIDPREGSILVLRSKDLNDVKIDELGQAPPYPVPSLRFVFVSSNVG